MRQAAVFFIFLALVGCGKTETESFEIVQTSATKTPAMVETTEKYPTIKHDLPPVKLSSKQKKYLDENLPRKVREMLENSERFEILAEIYGENESDPDSRTFKPNRIARITDKTEKKGILEAFFSDASREDSPAVCYDPHHAIRAVYKGKEVEVEICFSCARFFVKNFSEGATGTIVRENRKSEELIARIIESKGVEISK